MEIEIQMDILNPMSSANENFFQSSKLKPKHRVVYISLLGLVQVKYEKLFKIRTS